MSRIVLLCGLPGSGKSTLARRLAGERGALRLCPDEWIAALDVDLYDEAFRARVEALQWDLAQQLLQLGTSVVIEWGVWARRERDAIRERGHELGVPVELHFLEVPFATLWERVRDRNERGQPGRAVIRREDLLEWSEHRFEAPTPAEQSLFDPPPHDLPGPT